MKKGIIKMVTKTHPAGIAVVVAIVLLSSLAAQYAFAQDLKSEPRAPAPLARISGVASAAKGKVYFIGGITKAQENTGVVHEFDPTRNDWSTKTTMPTPRGSAAAVELNECIYVLGGRRENNILPTVEKYDPANNSWSKCAPMPTPRWHLMAAVVDGKVYAMGGIAGVGNVRRVLDVVEVYDPAKDSWTSLAAMPIGNSNAGAATIGSKIHLIGGRVKAGADAEGSATSKVFVYDAATGKWETGPSLNQERTGLEACAVEGTIFAVGGASRGNSTASVEVLLRGQEKWHLLQALRRTRTDHNCAVVGKKIYVVGGASTPSVEGIENTMEELSPTGILLAMPEPSQTQDVGKASGKISFRSQRDGNWEIYVMNPDGSGQTRITKNNWPDDQPRFSPDAKKIVLRSEQDGNQDIYIINADGSDEKRLTTDPSKDSEPAFSPDGKKIVFASKREGDWRIYIMNTDGSQQRALSQINGSGPRYSPDGKRIVFSSMKDGNPEIYIMDADGKGVTRLTNNSTIDSGPSFSADGKKIVFTAMTGGNAEVCEIPVGGGDARNISRNPANDGAPCYSPDGKEIVFVSDRGGNLAIYVMKSDGSEAKCLTLGQSTHTMPHWAGMP